MSAEATGPIPDITVPVIELAGAGLCPSPRKKMQEAEDEGEGPPPPGTLKGGTKGEGLEASWWLRLRYPSTASPAEEGGPS